MRTYNKRFNAQRAARTELGDDAIEGIDFRTVKTTEGWIWTQGRKPADSMSAIESDSVHISDRTAATDPAAPADAESWNAVPAIKRAGRRAAAEEVARSGALPEPPDFSAETHKRFRAKLAKLVALAVAGDIDSLKAVTINPVSSSPKAMARYRDLCIIALGARK